MIKDVLLQVSRSYTPYTPPKELWGVGIARGGGLDNNLDWYRFNAHSTDNTWVSASTAQLTTFAIKDDGTLWGWGVNSSGQLGLNDTAYRSSPVQIGTLTTWKNVLTSGNNSWAIRTDGTLWAWGASGVTFGISGSVSRSSPVQIGTQTNWSSLEVAGAGTNTQALKTDGTRWAWGQNTVSIGGFGQFWYGQVVGEDFVSASLSSTHNIAIKRNGTMWTWGTNTNGALGLNDTLNRSFPVQIGTLSNWADASTIGDASLAIKTDGTLWAWGNNSQGQLGDGSLVTRSSPVQIGTLTNWKNISGGYSFAVKTDGTLWYWGAGTEGQLGNDRTIYDLIQVGSDTNWYQVAMASNHVLAIKETNPGDGYGTLWGWGVNAGGQLGLNDTVSRSSPVQIGTIATWKFIATKNEHCHAIRNDGTLWSWGQNNTGQLGLTLGSTAHRSSPVQVGTLTNWSMVECGHLSNTTHAIKTDGTLWAWGTNTSGEFGDGTKISRSSPVQIGTRTNWSDVADANAATFVLDNTNALYVAGFNGDGRLGVNDTTERTTLTLLDTGIQKISAHQRGGYYIKTNGTLWSWGTSTDGALGLGDTVARSSPVQIGTRTNWSQIEGGLTHALALTNDSKLWFWGASYYDRLVTARSSPVQLGTKSDWTKLSASTNVAAIDALNNLYVSVNGDTTSNRHNIIIPGGFIVNSPVQLGSSTDWEEVDGGGASITVAKKTNGTIWSWGANNQGTTFTGMLGQSLGDSQIRIASPVQIGTETNWSTIRTGGPQTVALKTDGTIWSWGSLPGASNDRPTRIGTLSNWVGIGTGFRSGLFIDNTGYVWLIGDNTNGELGQGDTVSIRSLTTLTRSYIGSPITAIAKSKTQRTGIILNSNAIWTAGGTNYGVLGWENGIVRDPVQVFGETWTNIKGVGSHIIGLKPDNTLWTWGINGNGQLGFGDTTNRSLPTQLGTATWTSIGAGGAQLYAIKTDGTMWSWGTNTGGELGDGTTLPKSSPVQIGIDTNWGELYKTGTGVQTFFASKTNGTLWGWANNTSGQLGLGEDLANRSNPTQITALGTSAKLVSNSTTDTVALSSTGKLYSISTGVDIAPTSPVLITNKTKWSNVSLGNENAIVTAVDTEGSLWSWGINSSFQLGIGNGISRSSPVQVGTLKNWSYTSIGFSHTMAVKTDGTLWAWGINTFGVLGDGTVVNKSSPVQIGTLSDWSKVYAGARYTMAIKTNGTLWGWGSGTYIFNDTVTRSSPVQIGTLNNWSTLAVSSFDASQNYTSLGIRTDGTLWTWGNDNFGLSGLNAANIVRSSPVQVGTDTNWSKVSIGRSNAMAIKTDGSMWGWGLSTYLGNAKIQSLHSQIDYSTGYNEIHGDLLTFISKKTDGTLWGWGTNTSGQLGLNDVVNRSTSVQLNGETWSTYSISENHTLAIKTNGTLWAWGPGTNGQLGNTSLVTRSSPVQVGTETNWSKVSAGTNHSLAIKTNGTLWGWGLNTSGQVGDITLVTRSSPVQIGTRADWTAVGAGGLNFSVALRSDNTMWSWGVGTVGVTGQNDTVTRSSPVQIGTLAAWSKISTGVSHTMAIRTNGTLWGWGLNTSGQIGDTSLVTKSSPVQIGTRTDWTDISAGSNITVARRGDGTVWAWGVNTSGQLGDNSAVTRSSPVQIGTTGTWNYINAGSTHTLLIDQSGSLYTAGAANVGLGYYPYSATIHRSSPILLNASADWSDVWISDSVSAIKTNGTIWSWGANINGTLGDPNAGAGGIVRSSPVQVGSETNWTTAPVGFRVKLGIRSY